jgi:kynurenine formamidase
MSITLFSVRDMLRLPSVWFIELSALDVAEYSQHILRSYIPRVISYTKRDMFAVRSSTFLPDAMLIVIDIDGEDQAMVGHDRPINISLPVTAGESTNAFGLPRATFSPFQSGDFIGSVEAGGPVQCEVVTLAPHGNGTHTECIGHIAGSRYHITECMRDVLTTATLVTVDVQDDGRGLSVSRSHLVEVLPELKTPTLVLRTTPNDENKKTRLWSGSNPPFITPEAMQYIVDLGTQHLVVDLPSVDPEQDGGALTAHHIFWQWPEEPREYCTITELVYIPDSVRDGRYGVFFGIAPFASDAAPSTISLLPLAVSR